MVAEKNESFYESFSKNFQLSVKIWQKLTSFLGDLLNKSIFITQIQSVLAKKQHKTQT
jgi:hypothetical protein